MTCLNSNEKKNKYRKSVRYDHCIHLLLQNLETVVHMLRTHKHKIMLFQGLATSFQ